MTTFGLLVFDDVTELDFVGPWEVFTASSRKRVEAGHEADVVVTIGLHDGPIRCSKGVRVLPDHTIADHPDIVVLLVPGGSGARALVGDDGLLSWIAAVEHGTRYTTSVCSGAYLLFHAGPAKDKRVATHLLYEDALEAEGAKVVRNSRWVVGGKVVTSQGVSAGIDMAVSLIGDLYGADHGRAVQRHIQYEPEPPYR
jgi:transcriptional regulator GlxA family with amidase domain